MKYGIKGNLVVFMLIVSMLFGSISIGIHIGWYYKPPFPNYAPSGMPDFDQKQDAWKVIEPGPNGVINSVPAGDDYYNSNENRIVPGNNCRLETTPAGDDVAVWAFCGPVAAANCLWWFDSKYADPKGTPGDGKDKFELVKDYGVGDDHSANNVPKLIEDLARRMKTNTKGTTYIDDMKDAIENLLKERKLDKMLGVSKVDKPSFNYIEREVERSQDVILLLGYYNVEPTDEKLVDQQQTLGPFKFPLIPSFPGHAQSFIPTVNVLDAVQLLLSWNVSSPTVDVFIWDKFPNATLNPIGASSMQLGAPSGPVWVQFHFDRIILKPGSTYYISAVGPEGVYWHYINESSAYPNGAAFIWDGNNYWEEGWDFAFKTEYYGTQLVRKGGHYVTVAGVNSAEKKLAISDPYYDNAESGGPGRVLPPHNPHPNDPTLHNDAKYVSHDYYTISTNVPKGLPAKFMLLDYPAGYNYTIVEGAVIICPIINVDGHKHSWDWERQRWTTFANYSVNDTIRFKITLENTGGLNFTFIVLNDTLPEGVIYAGNATPFEPRIEDNKLIWEIEQDIPPGESISIEFDTRAVMEGHFINVVRYRIFAGEEEISNESSTEFIIRHNSPPNKPSRPSGPTRGFVGREYSYSTSAVDPDGDKLYYLFDWGDGNNSGWLGPYNSGEIIKANHTWREKGNYEVRVKAKDIHGVESEWSEPLPITMPKNMFAAFIEFLGQYLKIFGREVIPLFPFF